MDWEHMYKRLIQRIYDDVSSSIDYLEKEEKNGKISKENKEYVINGLYQALDVCNNEIYKNEVDNDKKIDVGRNVKEKVKEIESKYIFDNNNEY